MLLATGLNIRAAIAAGPVLTGAFIAAILVAAIIPAIITPIVTGVVPGIIIVVRTVVVAAIVEAIIVFFAAGARAARTAIIIVPAILLRIAGIVALIVPLGAGFILTDLVVIYDTKIMVGELQKILGLNPVAIMLRVLGQFLVFIEQLRRIAPRTAINPVKLASATTALWAITITTAATTIVVTIVVVQGKSFPLGDQRPDKLPARSLLMCPASA